MTEQRRLEDVALAYLAQYAGRTDTYVHWIPTSEGGQPARVAAPLTPDVVISAFRTKRPVSGYVNSVPDAEGRITSHLAALDVDIEPGGMAIAERIVKAMRRTGIPAYLESSRRGAHVWIVLDRPLPAPIIRRALRALIEAADVAWTPEIELRPGSDKLSGPGGFGFALRLPLMPHQLTGLAGELMEPGGKLVAAKMAEAVLNVDWAPATIVEEWAQRWTPAVDPREIPPSFRRPRPRRDDADEATVVEQLAELGVRAIPGRAVKCPFHDDNHPSLSIARDERRVFCKNPSCDASNGGRGLGTAQLRDLIGRRAA